jgi:acyl-CoA thioester hydrolase
MDSAFEFKLRVRYGECDAQLVVFNARYADYTDLAVTEYLRYLFGGVIALLKQGLDTQVVRFAIDWTAPARFDDVLILRIRPGRVGNTSFTLHLSFSNAANGQDLAQADIVYVLVRAHTLDKLNINDTFRAKLLAGAPGVCINQSGDNA